MTKRWVYLFIILIPLTAWTQSQIWEWKTFTSSRQIRDMVYTDNHLWCATEGGLIVLDVSTGQFDKWTNTEGLASTNLTCIAKDEENNIWIGSQEGILQQYHPDQGAWFTLYDFKGYPIHCIEVLGDSLFIGLDIGISVYLISRQEVKETYKHLGVLLEPEIPVYDIRIFQNQLWALTADYLTHTDLTNTNLLDPQFWIPESPDPLLQPEIRAIAVYDERIYTGTDQGVYERTESGAWSIIDETEEMSVVHFLKADELFMMTETALYRLKPSWAPVKNDFPTILSSAYDGYTLFIGTIRGIYFMTDNQWQSYIPDGPDGNFFSDLAVDEQGGLWCCTCDYRGNSGNGIYYYAKGQWTSFNRSNTPALGTDLVTNVVVDYQNRKWFGTWGKGLAVLTGDTTWNFYRPENGYLDGIEGAANYAVVKKLAVDLNNTLWILNRQAENGQCLVSVTKDDIWTYYGYRDGLSNTYVWDIAVDGYNRKWISTALVGGSASGAFVYDDNFTPEDKGDDRVSSLSSSDGLLSGNVQAVAVDEDNIVWLGTDLGLNYFSGSDLKESYGISENVRTLMVDGANNLWMGTGNGICFLSNETREWTCFNTNNSGLVHDEVISLALDPNSGTIYIGTSGGLSLLKTPFSYPIDHFADLRIYPNPFIIDEHKQVLIENLPRDVTVSILSSQGYQVLQKKPADVFGNTYAWDGKDQSGREVPAGIYIVMVNSVKGERAIGKLAVIR